MREGRIFLVVCLTALLTACAAPPPPPSPSPQPSRTAIVDKLIAQAEAQPRSGGRLEALKLLDEAAAQAAGDPALLAAVAGAVLDWDWQLGLDMARRAVAAGQSSPEALTALGAALYRTGKLAEARAPLEKAYEASEHGLEPGLHLALTLESLGEFARAGQVLGELNLRYPWTAAVEQARERLDSVLAVWPAPGSAGTPVAGWKQSSWWAAGDLLIGVREGEQTLEAIGPDGAVRWQLSCGGRVNDVAFDPNGERAILFTPETGCLFDLKTGALLGSGPGAGPDLWLGGFDWRGDSIAIGSDVPPPPGAQGMLAVAYFGTTWDVWRLVPAADGTTRFDHLYRAKDGSRRAALSQDGQTLLSWYGNHGAGRPRLFKGGALVTDYPKLSPGAEFALDPRDDRYYMVGYDGTLQARRLEGELLWQAPAGQYGRPVVWSLADGSVQVAVMYQDRITVYTEQGALLWTAPGIPYQAVGTRLMVNQAGETRLLDAAGAVVARYPNGSFLRRGARTMVNQAEGRIIAYSLSQKSPSSAP